MKIKAGQFFFRELECCWVVLWYLTGEERKRGTDVGVLGFWPWARKLHFMSAAAGEEGERVFGVSRCGDEGVRIPRKERPIFSHMKIKTWEIKASFILAEPSTQYFFRGGLAFSATFLKRGGSCRGHNSIIWPEKRGKGRKGNPLLCVPLNFFWATFFCTPIYGGGWVGGEGIITPVKTRRRCCCCPLYSPGGREFFPSSVVVVTGVKWSDAFPASI